MEKSNTSLQATGYLILAAFFKCLCIEGPALAGRRRHGIWIIVRGNKRNMQRTRQIKGDLRGPFCV